jgi:peptidyl-tRNA hydrolase
MTTSKIDRLYIVVRDDLDAGAQIAQACHALRLFHEEHPEVDASWYSSSNTLVVLSVEDEYALLTLSVEAARKGLRFSIFQEPDLGDQSTAMVLEPRGKRICRGLPLALAGDWAG